MRRQKTQIHVSHYFINHIIVFLKVGFDDVNFIHLRILYHSKLKAPYLGGISQTLKGQTETSFL